MWCDQLEYAEPLQIVYYGVGQEYRKHWDAYDTHTARGQTNVGKDGNRILTALGYINSVTDDTGVSIEQEALAVRYSTHASLIHGLNWHHEVSRC